MSLADKDVLTHERDAQSGTLSQTNTQVGIDARKITEVSSSTLLQMDKFSWDKDVLTHKLDGQSQHK